MSVSATSVAAKRRIATAAFVALAGVTHMLPARVAAFDYAQIEFGLETPVQIRSRLGDGIFTHALPGDTVVGQTGFLAFLADGIDIQGYASDLGLSEFLLSISGHSGWPGAAIVHPSQIIDLAGQVRLDLVADLGLPGNVKIDAITLASDGSIEFSVDRYVRFQNETFSPADLLHFDGSTLRRRFDAVAAAIPDGVNLDAAHRLLRGQSAGLLLLSFDVALRTDGITVEDEDLALATSNSLLGLAEDLDLRFPVGIGAGNDLDAVSMIEQFPGFIVLIGPPSVVEGQDSEIAIQVARLHGGQGALALSLSTTPGAPGFALAAMPGVDYSEPEGTATWADGETNLAREISIPVLDNAQSVGDRAFQVGNSLAPGIHSLSFPLVVVIEEDDVLDAIFGDGFE